MNDQPVNAANPVEVKGREKKERNEQEQYLEDVRDVLSAPAGRRVLWNIIETTQPMSEAFTGNSTTFYNEGRQSIGRALLNMLLDHFPERYLEMKQEADERKKRK